MIEQSDIIQDIEVEVHHKTIITTTTIFHTPDIVLLLEIDLIMAKIPFLRKAHDHDMTIIKEIQDLIHRLTDPHIDLLLDVTLVPEMDHANIQETTIFQGTHLPSDHLEDKETLDVLDHGPIPLRDIKLNTIHPQNQNDPINCEVHMYHPTAMTNALTSASWFYSLYTHTPPNKIQQDYPSRLEISFLLVSGASISVLNHPTYVTIGKHLNI